MKKWTTPFLWQINNPAKNANKAYWRARIFETINGVDISQKFINGMPYKEYKPCRLLNLIVNLKWILGRLEIFLDKKLINRILKKGDYYGY